jgi:site-specific recombinase XerD
MVSTGLAIVDASGLKKENFKDGWLNVQRHKTGRLVQQQLNSGLLKELKVVTNGNPEYVFWNNGATKLSSLTGLFQANLRELMKDAGLYYKGDLSHRFRDTAADFWFGQGLGVTEVAAMLGDTEAVVTKHYQSLIGRIKQRREKVPQRKW